MDEAMGREEVTRLLARPERARRAADKLREDSVGENVTFVINRNINFTDVCINACSFCAFANREGFLYTPEMVAARARHAADGGATEVCVQGGLHPDLALEDYLALVRAVRRVAPALHVHAFSPQEVAHAAQNAGCCVEDALRELRSAGLNSMPGTAAEILIDRVRHAVCPEKLDTASWVEVVTCAHELGIRTSSTMLYGIGEGWDERLDHLFLLRSIQEETGGFTEFVPLSFVHPNTPLFHERGIRAPGSVTDLLMLAASRLVLHPVIPNIQVSWVKLGPQLAARGLGWGANDVGGTLGEENITRLAGGGHGCSKSAEDLVALIRRTGRRPVQRTTLYSPVRVY